MELQIGQWEIWQPQTDLMYFFIYINAFYNHDWPNLYLHITRTLLTLLLRYTLKESNSRVARVIVILFDL